VELLDIWERGLRESSPDRAARLLAAACDAQAGEIGALTPGEREGRLLTLREWTFGPELASVAVCPECQEQLEFSVHTTDLRASPEIPKSATMSVEAGGLKVEFRLPTCADLASAEVTDAAELARNILQRCVIAASRGDERVPADALPPNVRDAIEDCMERADPQADIQLTIACERCGREWRQHFDTISFFWAELDTWAQRLLREVHVLASAYGWREADILALPAWRRQAYIEMTAG
jgi:hypothetical protein